MTAESSQITVTAPNRVLIILLGAIGDVVRALPLLGRVRHAWPQAHIAWAVEPKSSPIIEAHPWVDQLIIYDRRHAPWSFAPFLQSVRRGRFDLVIDLQRHLKSGIIGMVSRAPERIGFAAANTKELNHRFTTRQIEAQPKLRLKLIQYQAFADALGLPPTPIEFGLSLPHDEDLRARAFVAEARRPLVGVILGSSWPSRLYFPESIAAVIRALARPADGSPALFPVLIGGADDAAIGDAVVRALDGLEVLNLVGRTRLRDLVGIFSECAVAFGPDCGPMHIAAAMGRPVVSLWGSTAPERSAPWGNAEFALRGEIPCHPCYLRDCPIGRECMRRIAPEQVVAMVHRAWRGRAGETIAGGAKAEGKASGELFATIASLAERAG
jgi:lipopolysaccharide heptosyltransferase II